MRENPTPYAVLVIFLTIFSVYFSGFFADYAYDSTIVMSGLRPESPKYDLTSLWWPSTYWREAGILSWRPLVLLSYLTLDAGLFGYRAAFSHGLDFLLHSISTTFIFLTAFRRFRMDFAPAFLGALFFAVHPLATEVVMCPGFRFDSLALVFISICLYVATGQKAQWRLVVYTVALFGALLSKEIGVVAAVMTPVAVALIQRPARAIPYALASVGVLVIFLPVWAQFKFPQYATGFLGGGGRSLGIANFLVSSAEVYLPGLLSPFILRIDHEFVPVTSIWSPRVGFSLLLIVVLAALLLLACWRTRQPALWFGALWIPIAFAPISQIVPVPDPVAERFCYVPMAGVAFVIAGLLTQALKRRWVLAPVTIVLLLLAVRTGERTRDWQDDITLNIANWQDSPTPTEKATIHLAGLYLAVPAYYRSVRVRSEHALVLAYDQLRILEEQFPSNPDGWRLRSLYHLRMNQPVEARAALHTAKLKGLSDDLAAPILRRIDEVESLTAGRRSVPSSQSE